MHQSSTDIMSDQAAEVKNEPAPYVIRPDIVAKFISILEGRHPGGRFESRILNAQFGGKKIVPGKEFKSTFSMWGRHQADFFNEAHRLGVGVSAYLIPNPVDPAQLGDLPHEYVTRSRHKGRRTTNDDDILAIKWVYIDIDSDHPTGISATNEELSCAIALRDAIIRDEPELVDCAMWGISGNGCWMLIPVDLPNDEASRRMVADVQRVLADRYGNNHPGAKIDTATKNPARLMPLPGTMKCKGEHTAGRPWRPVTLAHTPPQIVPCDIKDWLRRNPPPPIHREQRAEVAPSRLKRRSNSRTNALTPYVMKAVEEECQKVATTPSGGRNNTLNEAACAVGNFLHSGVFTRPEAEAALTNAGLAAGLEPSEIQATIRSGLDAGERQPRDLSSIASSPQKRGRLRLDQAHGPESKDAPGEDEADSRPSIEVTFDEYAVNDQAADAIGDDANTYQRGGVLVRIIREKNLRKMSWRSPGSPYIGQIPVSIIRDTLTRVAEFVVIRQDPETGEDVIKRCSIPDWTAGAVMNRGAWDRVRYIEGIVEAPTIRPDGTILDAEGWDRATGLVLMPNGSFPAIPDRPGRDDAVRAAEILLDIVSDFPFAQPTDRSAWLALFLSLLGRFAIDGPVPMFLIDANTAGSGKTKLATIAILLATGREPAATPIVDDTDELSKLVLALAMEGARYVLLDNANTGGILGNRTMDAVLTATKWKGRVLQVSQTKEHPLHAVWITTGNNLAVKGDLARRIVRLRLESSEERPEIRTGFKIPDLDRHVRKHRGELVVAGLTILRAHALSDWPRGASGPVLGSFESWDRVVRSALAWVGLPDPLATADAMRMEDPDALLRKAIIHGWAELPASRTRGLTAGEALAKVNESPGGYPTLRGALSLCSRDGGMPSSRELAMKLRSLKGVVVGGLHLENAGEAAAGVRWRVQGTPIHSAPSGNPITVEMVETVEMIPL